MKLLRQLRLLCLLAACPLACAAADSIPGTQQWPLRLPPEHPADVDDDFADLAPLGEKLASAQVVALGEQSHGGSDEFRYRLRLVRYLHEKLGFDVLLLESGFYDMGRLSHAVMSRNNSLDELAPGNVFYMYANSAEGRELLRYVEKQRRAPRRLDFAGIDSQHTGTLARTEMLNDLHTAVERIAPGLLSDEAAWATYQQRVLALVALDRQAPKSAAQADFLAYNRRLQAAFCGDRSPVSVGGPAWWCRVTASIEAQARSIWSQDRDYQRDNAMGDNTAWLVDQLFRGRKAIIWAHTIHVAKGLQRDAEHLQAGEVLQRHWGKAYQVVNFTATTGSYLDFIDMKPKALQPPPAGSLEARLPAGQTLLLRAADKPLALPQYGIDYRVDAWPVAMQLGRNWDWLIALAQLTPVQMTR